MAGGDPFGGTYALQPLVEEFPNIVTKQMLSRGDELSPYTNRPSVLAAIDYIVSLSSDVFMPSHGGNMGRALQVHYIISAWISTDQMAILWHVFQLKFERTTNLFALN